MRRRMVAVPRVSAGAATGRAPLPAGLGDDVQRSLAQRIRWGNLLRLAAAVAVVALVVAWPRIASPPPRLEGDEPVAVAPGESVAPVAPRAAERPRPVPRRPRPRRVAKRRAGTGARARKA